MSEPVDSLSFLYAYLSCFCLVTLLILVYMIMFLVREIRESATDDPREINRVWTEIKKRNHGS